MELWDATAVLQAQEEESASRQAAAEVIAGVLRNRLAELEAEVEEKSAHNLVSTLEGGPNESIASMGNDFVLGG